MSEITDQLKTTRRERGLKQSELGEKLGLPQSHISRIEQGVTDPRLSTVADLARVLDLELMLIPRQLIPVVRALIRGDTDEEAPIWQPDEPGDS